MRSSSGAHAAAHALARSVSDVVARLASLHRSHVWRRRLGTAGRVRFRTLRLNDAVQAAIGLTGHDNEPRAGGQNLQSANSYGVGLGQGQGVGYAIWHKIQKLSKNAVA